MTINTAIKGLLLSGILAGILPGSSEHPIASRPEFEKIRPFEIENVSPFPSYEDSLGQRYDSLGLDYEVLVRIAFNEKKLENLALELDSLSHDEVLEKVNHPIGARILILGYLKRNGPRKIDTPGFYCFKRIHDNKEKVDCSEASIIAAASLSDDGYRPLILVMNTSLESYLFGENYSGHAVFLYKRDNKFGYVGVSGITGPVYDNVEDIVDYFSEATKFDYVQHQIIDLDKSGRGWTTEDSALERKISYD